MSNDKLCVILIVPNQFNKRKRGCFFLAKKCLFSIYKHIIEFDKNANFDNVFVVMSILRYIGLATDGVCVFYALTSVSAFFIFKEKKVMGIEGRTTYEGAIKKCSNCGAILVSFVSVCPSCGHELRSTSSSSAVLDFSEKLSIAKTDYEKINIIKNFIIPNTKEDIFEFMILAESNFDASYYIDNLYREDVSDAWLVKIEQCYQKAKIILKEPRDLQKIEILYNKIIIDLEQQKKLKNKRLFNNNLKRNKKTIITITSIILAIILIVVGVSIIKNNQDPNLIRIGISSENIKGEYYYDIEELLQEKGFINIETRADGKKLFQKNDTIKSISINGMKSFSKLKKFPKDAQIIILYYG